MFRPQDVSVLASIFFKRGKSCQQQEVAAAVGLSPAEITFSLRRSAAVGLYDPQQKRTMREPFGEFLIHGLKYVVPAALGAIVRGVPTAWSVAPLNTALLNANENPVVWPHPRGSAVGASVDPLYSALPDAAMRDEQFHEFMALIDTVRLGRTRERRMAEQELLARLV